MESAIKNNLIKELKNTKVLKPEFKFDSDTRFDFLCDKKIIEVKNVTLLRNDQIAEFPDAITSRGTKHLLKLVKSLKNGFSPNVLFLTQIPDIKYFKIAKDIDENYYKNYLLAKKAGVKFLAYNCKVSSKEIIAKTLEDAETAKEYISNAKEKFFDASGFNPDDKTSANYAKELSNVIKQLRKLFIPALEEKM